MRQCDNDKMIECLNASMRYCVNVERSEIPPLRGLTLNPIHFLNPPYFPILLRPFMIFSSSLLSFRSLV